ncbi:hypothetical protein ABZ061_35540 [Streptomyces mutabilis]|uniref:hypothetical protein n=1 Tax=Streptomyces mutabilis TaxID=67332 RepID=UPI0033B6766C
MSAEPEVNVELYSRSGFGGPFTTIVRAQYLPDFKRAEGDYLPRRFQTWKLADEAFAGAHALPVPILTGDGLAIEVNRLSGPPAHAVKNVAADELHYVVDGGGELDTMAGVLQVRAGDFVRIPRGIAYRWNTLTAPLNEVVVTTSSEITVDPQNAPGTFNPDLHLDVATPHGRPGGPVDGEYEVVFRHGDRLTSYFFDYDPLPCLDVKGAPPVVRVNIEHVHGLAVDDGGLQPARLFGSVSGRDLLFGINSRRSDRPPVHHNVDYDEIICYAAGPTPWGGVDTPGTVTWVPKGVLHQGPEEDVQPGYKAWLLETRVDMTATPAGLGISQIMETNQYGVHPSNEHSAVSV